MQDTTTTLVAPAARQGGTAECPSSKVRIAEGYTPPRARFASLGALTSPRARSASLEALTPPRAGSASLEGTCTHVAPAPAPVYVHLML
jgi:hypothetical protein